MRATYHGYNCFSASKFIEHNSESLKREKSRDVWDFQINDGCVLYFLDDDFNCPEPLNNKPGLIGYTYTFKAKLNGSIVNVPAWKLYSSYNQIKYSFTNIYADLTRSTHYLGGAWNVTCHVVNSERGKLTLLLLSPADEQERAKWEIEKMERQRDIEIDAYRREITQHYDNQLHANTKIETIVLKRQEEFDHASSRVTWGEGYQYIDWYKVTTNYIERTYFKGLLLKERQYKSEDYRHD